MKRFDEIKNMIAAARSYDDTNAIEDLEEMGYLYAGDAVTEEEIEILNRLLAERNERISHAIQVASIACVAAGRARGGVAADHNDIYRAAYDMCLDEVEKF